MTDPSEASAVGDDRRALRPGDDAVPWSATIIDRSIPERFAEIVRQGPDRPAVVAGGTVTSYAGLDLRTAAIAAAIHAATIDGPAAIDATRPIALFMDQGPDVPAAALAALRTGAPFVPVDPAYPDGPLRSRLDHAGAAVVLAATATVDQARRVAGDRPVIDVGAIGVDARPDDRWVDPSIEPDAPATLFYTSGSTGRPKGVLDSHRNVLHNVGRYTTSLCIGRGDRLTLLHAPTFSGIVSTLFAGLLNGAAILPFDLRHRGLDAARRWLVEERATMLHCVPVVARAIFTGEARFPDLRVVRLEGDIAMWSDVERFAAHTADGATLVNGLGATETGLTRQFFVTGHRLADRDPDDDRTGALPIGYPLPDMTVRIHDTDDRPVTDGSPGEIVVSSRFLALGYHRDPERTAAAFSRDPDDPSARRYRTGDLGRLEPDSRLHHLGRVDGSAKVTGQTVDPIETERVLGSRPEIRAAVAVIRQDGPGAGPRLVAYVVREAGRPLDPVRLRRELADELPDAEVPSFIVEIPDLPLTSAGKVDRSALPAPGHGRPPLASAFRSASDPLEEELVARWSAATGVAPVGVDDDFFELGGDSLAALRMLLEVGDDYGRELPADVLVRAPTIAALATELRTTQDAAASARSGDPATAGDTAPRRDPATAGDHGLLRLADGAGAPLFAIHAARDRPWLFRSVVRAAGWDRPLYSLAPDGSATTLGEDADIERTASAHLARIRAVRPTGPYHLAGFCYGGLIAFEVAHRLRAEGEDVALLALLSITPLEFPTLIAPAARRRYGRSVLRQRVRWVADRWARGTPMEAVDDLADRVTGLVSDAVYRRLARRRRPGPDGHVALHQGWFGDAPGMRAARAAAVDAYDARPFPGPVTVVVGRDAVPRFLRDPRTELAGLSSAAVRVAVLPGDDHAMLAEPEVGALAGILMAGSSEAGRYDSPHGE